MVLATTSTTTANPEQQQDACQSSRRQAGLFKSQACSSRSLISMESVQSILALDSDCSDDESESESGYYLEHSMVSVAEDGRTIPQETSVGGLTEERSIELIQESWKKMLNSQRNDKKAVGEQLVLSMLKIKPSCSTALGVSSSSEQTPRFAELCTSLCDMMDRLVAAMGPDLCDEDLAEEWIEEGLDARLVYKAVIDCLEQFLESDDYSYEVAEAWSTTFRDTLQKIVMF